jgi:hypothetical protein
MDSAGASQRVPSHLTEVTEVWRGGGRQMHLLHLDKSWKISKGGNIALSEMTARNAKPKLSLPRSMMSWACIVGSPESHYRNVHFTDSYEGSKMTASG